MRSTNSLAHADGWRADAIRRIRLRRRGASGNPEVIAALEAEVELLQDENAYLKAERQRGPDSARVVDELRALSGAIGEGDSSADEAWHVLVELLVIREGLLEVCQQIVPAMVAVERRLSAMKSLERLGLSLPLEQDAAANGHGAPDLLPVELHLSPPVEQDAAANGHGGPHRNGNGLRNGDGPTAEAAAIALGNGELRQAELLENGEWLAAELQLEKGLGT